MTRSAQAPSRHPVLALFVVAMALGVLAVPRIPQPASYHCLADARSWFGVPNTLNVLSNLPFAYVGVLGLMASLGPDSRRSDRFATPWERWPYVALFTGVALTSIGSAYYHLAPDNARLVWDRLPMALGFMGLLSAVLAERVGVVTARRWFPLLLALGPISVLYWSWTEHHGAGDLRLYGLVQFGSFVVIALLILLYRPRYSGVAYFVVALVTYAAAMAFDRTDHQVFAVGHLVSGHTLKHLTAAGAVYFLVAMLRTRVPVTLPVSGGLPLPRS